MRHPCNHMCAGITLYLDQLEHGWDQRPGKDHLTATSSDQLQMNQARCIPRCSHTSSAYACVPVVGCLPRYISPNVQDCCILTLNQPCSCSTIIDATLTQRAAPAPASIRETNGLELLFRRLGNKRMRNITEESTQFEFLPFETDLDDVRWAGGIQGTTATLVGSRVYLLGEARDRITDEVMQALCYIDLVSKASKWTAVLPNPLLTKFFSFLVADTFFVVDLVGVWKLDLLALEWARLETRSNPPCVVEDCIGEFVEQSRHAVFFGGRNDFGVRNMVFAIDIDSLKWTECIPAGRAPAAREGHVSCSVARRQETIIFMFGGNTGRICNELYALHCNGHKYRWSQIALGCPVEAVAYGSINNVDGMLLIYGGFNTSLSDSRQLVRYDTRSGAWMNLSENVSNPETNSFQTAITIDEGILIFGGYQRFISDVVLLRAVDTDKA